MPRVDENVRDYDWYKNQWPDMVELAKKCANTINTMHNDRPGAYTTFVKTMAQQHRTNQQSFTRLVVAWLLELAKMGEDDYYDERNEDSVKMAMDIKKKVIEHGLRFI